MKFLEYLEKAWLFAAAVSLIVGIINILTIGSIVSNRVYFPFICSMFCVLIWFNVRGQRKFREKMIDEQKRNHHKENEG